MDEKEKNQIKRLLSNTGIKLEEEGNTLLLKCRGGKSHQDELIAKMYQWSGTWCVEIGDDNGSVINAHQFIKILETVVGKKESEADEEC